jgi:hypothetical protein
MSRTSAFQPRNYVTGQMPHAASLSEDACVQFGSGTMITSPRSTSASAALTCCHASREERAMLRFDSPLPNDAFSVGRLKPKVQQNIGKDHVNCLWKHDYGPSSIYTVDPIGRPEFYPFI